MNILIENALILPMNRSEGELYFRGSLGVSGKRIAFVEEASGARSAEFRREHGADLKVIDGKDMLAMPGLVNIHNHCSMSLLRSKADDLPLMTWLNDHVWPLEAKFTRDDIYVGANLSIAEMLLGGTTTFADMYWSEEAVAEAVRESGIRAVLMPTFTDSRWDDFMEDYETVFGAYGDGSSDRITLMIAPHAPYSCSPEHLEKALELAGKHGVGINIHLAETDDETNIIKERFGKTPVEYVYDLGLLNERSIAVHCVHLTEGDIEIIKKSGCSVAHNPQSNMKLASGASPVARMLEEGICVGIGTDGPCSNNDLDMWDELRSASLLGKMVAGDTCALPAYEVLKMATVNGARALSLQDKIGQLKEGMFADIVLLDVCKPHLYPQHDMVANLVYAAKSSDVHTVIVNGRIVVERGALKNVDVKKLCAEAQKCIDEVMKR